jgi:hypothetical protein
MLTVFWMLGVVAVGWVMVAMWKRAGVMRPMWPETPPSSTDADYEALHPLLYSLDVFLPFVDLHQEHCWWPKTGASGECSILSHSLRISGSFLRYYLWSQVIAGWLLSAIFLAGVTGLMRSD